MSRLDDNLGAAVSNQTILLQAAIDRAQRAGLVVEVNTTTFEQIGHGAPQTIVTSKCFRQVGDSRRRVDTLGDGDA